MKKYLIFSLLFLTVIVSGCSNKVINENNYVDDSVTPADLQEGTVVTTTPTQENIILEATTTDKIYTDTEKQIFINFVDGYKKYNDTQIGFGPLGANLGPDPKDKSQSYHFQLDIKDYKSANSLINDYKVKNIVPAIININGFEVIKYVEGSICEDRVMEVVGKKYNYHFSADGCVNNQETDFNYLTETIKQLRIFE